MAQKPLYSSLMDYLAKTENGQAESTRLPTLDELSTELGISVSKLREQLEVARVLGFVEVRPRTGIQRLPYSFYPAVQQSLNYAIAMDWHHFESFASFRKHIEAAYWEEAARLLTPEDHLELQALMERAWEKLRGSPIIIPHPEHRSLHMLVFRRLENPFVLGMLEAFWDAYESVGLNLYADYEHLQTVWNYHQKMVNALCAGQVAQGYQAFIEHTDLLYHHPESVVPAAD